MKKFLVSIFVLASLMFAGTCALAQAPTISYGGSSFSYTFNAAITPLTPTSTNVTGTYGTPATFATGGNGTTFNVVTYSATAGAFFAVDNGGNLDKITTGGIVSQVNTNVLSNTSGAGIVVDGLGNIYVSDNGNNSVYEFSSTGSSKTRTITGFTTPNGLAVDGNNNVYVADGNGSVYKIAAGASTTKATLLTGFTNPYGIAVNTATGDIYVSQDGTNTSTRNVIKVAGAVTGGTTKTTFASGFSTAQNLTYDNFGDLFVADAAGLIKMISPAGTVTTVLSGLNGPGMVDFDPSGNLYIADNVKQIKESTVTYYKISATLPTGLQFNTSTGVISGTPTVVSAATNYTITAYNTSGSTAVTISIAVVKAPALSFNPTSYSFSNGVAITAFSVINSGGAISGNYSITGLPSGLIFTASTGTISGTPNAAVVGAQVTVSGTNPAGSNSAIVTITVINQTAPIITYSTPPTFVFGTTIASLSPGNSGGAVQATNGYSINPALPAGLSINTTTGVISGTPTTVATVNNYVVTATNAVGNGIFPVTITVSPAPLSITATNQTRAYGAANPTLTVSYNGFVNSNTSASLTTQPTVSTSATATSAVGSYNINASGAVDNNYTITYTVGALSVTKAALSITATDVNKTYGTPISGSTTSTAFTSSGLKNGETIGTVTTVYGLGASAASGVATYSNSITASVATGGTFNANNYLINYIQGNIIVGKAPLVATANNQSKIYGAANPTLTVSYAGFVNGDSQSSIGTLANAATTALISSNAGNYTITASGASDDNYSFSYVTGTLTITKAPLTVTADNITKTVGVAVTLTVTYAGFVNSDDNTKLSTQPVPSCTANINSGVGNYPITVSGGVSSNYTFTYVAGTLTITAAGPNTYDWTGATSTAWNTPQNWSINGTQQTALYPGATSVGDLADIGVNSNFSSHQPVLSTALPNNIGTLGFGANNANAVTLTVTGVTLTATTIIQDHNTDAGGATTNLAGTGTISCTTFTVGDNTAPPSPAGNFIGNFPISGSSVSPANNSTTLNSSIANLLINGNMTLNSTSSAIGSYSQIIIFTVQSYCTNNPVFNLLSGTVTVNNIITSNANDINNYNSGDPSFPTITNSTSYNMDLGTGVNTLNLLGASPITAVTGASFDFVSGGTVANSTVNYQSAPGIATQKIYTSADAGISSSPTMYAVLTLSNAAAKTINGGNLTTGGNFNTSGGAVNLNTNNPVVTIGGAWTNSTTVTEGTGAVAVTGNLANITGGTFTGSTAAAATTITGNVTNNSTITCNAETMTFNGNYTNTAIFTAGSAAVFFNGTTQTLQDNSTAGTTFNNVTFEKSGTKTMSGTGGFAVSSSGVLTMAGSATLAAGGVLTLNSDATGSATVAAIPTGTAITGNVNAQRFITGGVGYRGYRLLSSPVNAGGGNYSINYLENTVDLTGTAGTNGGFDKAGNPTLYLFRENLAPSNASFTSGNFRGVNSLGFGITNTSYLIDGDPGTFNIPLGNGYLFFFRGDKTKASLATETTANYVPKEATLTATGTLNSGTVTVHDWYTPGSANLGFTTTSGNAAVQGFNLVGNPYASSIDWDKYSASAGTGIQGVGLTGTIYVLTPGTSGNYNVYKAGKGGVGTFSNNSNILASGQGFFVVANAASAQLIFSEGAKTNTQVSSAHNNLFLGTPVQEEVSQYLHIMLMKDSVATDGTLISFESQSNTRFVRGEDAPYKVGNGTSSLSTMSADSIPMAINTMPLPKNSQVIRINVNSTTNGVYTLNLVAIKSIPEIYDIWLMDAYRKDSLDLRHNPTYSFNILKTDAASFGQKRFTLVIRLNPALDVHLLDFAAAKAVTGAQLVWKTENEQNYTNFTVERSTDNGANFSVIGGLTSNASGTYGLTDAAPVNNAADLYRLKLEDFAGNITYSKIVELMYGNVSASAAKGAINIYPNPTKTSVNLAITPAFNLADVNQLSNTRSLAAVYNIKIVNSTGSVIKTATSNSQNWQADVSTLIPGSYVIQVINSQDQTVVGRGTFIKL